MAWAEAIQCLPHPKGQLHHCQSPLPSTKPRCVHTCHAQSILTTASSMLESIASHHLISTRLAGRNGEKTRAKQARLRKFKCWVAAARSSRSLSCVYSWLPRQHIALVWITSSRVELSLDMASRLHTRNKHRVIESSRDICQSIYLPRLCQTLRRRFVRCVSVA